MAVANPIKPLLRRLSEAGYKENYVRHRVLPDWWEDCIALNPAGFQQAVMLLSRNLGLDPRSLQQEDGPIRCREFNSPKFKLKPADTPESVRVAVCIAFRAAQLACQAMPEASAELPSSAGAVRQAILQDEEVNADTDVEETEANQFAVELLTGYKHLKWPQSVGRANANAPIFVRKS